MVRDPDRESTWHVTATATPLPKGSRVVIFGDGLLSVQELPSEGRRVIGRGSEADIRIDHRSVSRKHAVLDLGPPLVVEDLGSQNGTKVRGVRLPSSARSIVGIGDPIAIGSVMIVVQTALAPSDSDSSIDDRFVREEFLSKKVSGGTLTLRIGGTVPLDVADHAVASSLTSSVIACRRGPREYVLAAIEGGEGVLDPIAREIEAAVAALGGSLREETASDHEQRALLATNMAAALLAHERHEEAAGAIENALAAFGGTRTPTAAMCFALLASAAEEHGRVDLAKPLYQRALEIEQALGHEKSHAMLAARVSALEPPIRRTAPRSLVVDRKRRIFRGLDGAEVNLARRRTLWALLEMLCEQRLAQPGRSVGRDELLARIWPGERMLPEAAQNRLYVAIAELRRFGLRDLLLHRDEGYAIDESIAVELS